MDLLQLHELETNINGGVGVGDDLLGDELGDIEEEMEGMG